MKTSSIMELSNLVNIVIHSPLTPTSGGSLALTYRSSQILDSEMRWLGNGLQSLHSYQGGLTPHHSLQMSSGKVVNRESSQRTEPGSSVTMNKYVSPGQQNHVQINGLRQGASDLSDYRYTSYYCGSQMSHVLQNEGRILHQQKYCNSLYCDICFIEVVWN